MKGSPQTPKTYSPSEISNAQGESNIWSAAAQSALNNQNKYNPIFSTTYNQSGSFNTPWGSVPQWSQNTNLSPLGQSFLDKVGASQNGADAQYLSQGPQQMDKSAADAIYKEQSGFLDPQWQQQGQQLEDQLARQGISVGSDAYSNAMNQFDNSKTQAYQSAQDQATAGGASAASQMFNMAMQGQELPLNEFNSLMNGQPLQQTSQTQISPNNVTGAYGLSSEEAWQNYQAQLQQQNAMWGGLSSLLGSLGSAAMFM